MQDHIPTTAPKSIVDQMNDFVEMNAKPVEIEVPPTAAQTREAMEAIRTQPGRPTRDVMIKQLMAQKGMTRAQAKEEIRRFDGFMVKEYLVKKRQADAHETSIGLKKVKPLTSAIFRGMGYDV